MVAPIPALSTSVPSDVTCLTYLFHSILFFLIVGVHLALLQTAPLSAKMIAVCIHSLVPFERQS